MSRHNKPKTYKINSKSCFLRLPFKIPAVENKQPTFPDNLSKAFDAAINKAKT